MGAFGNLWMEEKLQEEEHGFLSKIRKTIKGMQMKSTAHSNRQNLRLLIIKTF